MMVMPCKKNKKQTLELPGRAGWCADEVLAIACGGGLALLL
jgi:hypothetical protein